MKINREQVYKKYNGHCAYCGCEMQLKDMQVDHFLAKRNFQLHVKNKWRIPDFLLHLTEGDINHIDNLMPSCRVCNGWKTTHSLETFRDELQQQLLRLQRDSSNYRIAKKYGLITENSIDIKFYFEKIKGK